jgi:serine/threonine-protein kinase
MGSLLGATFAFAAAATFLIASSAADPAVPDLTGLEVPAAEVLLGGVGLRLAEGQARFDDRVPEGRIVFQDPPPGSFFKRGRSVQVFRSLGPTRRVVPRLEGSTLTEARRQLEAAELTVGRVAEVESDTYLAGRVIAQSPVAYTESVPETSVSVLLSAGSEPESFVMPDFIGRRYGDIADDLSRGAVRVRDVRRVPYRGVPAGIVVDQVPAAGAKVSRADRIVLTLSR